MTSEHVEGEEEGISDFVGDAREQFVKRVQMRRPMPVWLITLFDWLARESYRAGYRRAHQRPTVLPRQPAREEPADFEITFDDDTPVIPYPKG